MRFELLTLHPELVLSPLHHSILGRAIADGRLEVGVVDIREYASGRHRTADDAPYGGGAGMVMKVDVVASALEAVRRPDSYVLLTSAAGTPFTQAKAAQLARRSHVILLCGHYEGIDARIETLVDEQVSLGDFVLTGGEIAALAVIDATARLLPGVLGNAQSAIDESHSSGLLEYPHYTRPRVWRGLEVPAVLLSGHHGQIEAWRRSASAERTRTMRPDLWARYAAAQSRVDEPADEE